GTSQCDRMSLTTRTAAEVDILSWAAVEYHGSNNSSVSGVANPDRPQRRSSWKLRTKPALTSAAQSESLTVTGDRSGLPYDCRPGDGSRVCRACRKNRLLLQRALRRQIPR